MEDKIRGTGGEEFTVSVEEFDALEGMHEFSGKYEKKKKRMLKAYQRRVCQIGRAHV